MIQLFNENLRLQQQLQELRSSSNQTNETQDLEALQRSMNYTLAQPVTQSNVYQQQQAQQQQQLLLQQQQAQRTQMLQQTVTQEEQQTLKYVCCGNCQQWLSAPRNATYVYCPGCEAVNNCNLVSLFFIILSPFTYSYSLLF